jgi:hypothetical protein
MWQGETMLIDPIRLHNELSPIVEKLELLSRLSPVLETDQEFARTMTVVMQIISDYVAQLRRTLEALARAGDSQEGGRP